MGVYCKMGVYKVMDRYVSGHIYVPDTKDNGQINKAETLEMIGI